MNAIMSYYFLSQLFERDYVIFIKVEKDFKQPSSHDIHATHLSHKLDNHLEVRSRTPHFTAVVAVHLV